MKYLNSLNHYRALSIVFIVALHVIVVSEIKFESYFSKFVHNLISGSTINFVFISGFLFYLVFYKKYNYSNFLKGRINRFLKPYLILSILPIVISLIILPEYWDNSNYVQFNEDNPWLWYLISIYKYIITGAHITAYWYIPFILILALMSPLHIAFIKLKLKQQLIIFGVLLIVASFIQRPFERAYLSQAFQSLIYFTPLYLMGIICAMNKTRIYKLLKGKEFFLLAIVLLFVALQTNDGQIGLYKNKFLVYNGLDLNIFKMVFMCLFFMIWLHRFEDVRIKTIDVLANTSFAIYFLHVYILKLFIEIKAYYNVSFKDYTLLIYITTTVVTLVVSVLIAKGINRFLPKYSFLLIGYGKKITKPIFKPKILN